MKYLVKYNYISEYENILNNIENPFDYIYFINNLEYHIFINEKNIISTSCEQILDIVLKNKKISKERQDFMNTKKYINKKYYEKNYNDSVCHPTIQKNYKYEEIIYKNNYKNEYYEKNKNKIHEKFITQIKILSLYLNKSHTIKESLSLKKVLLLKNLELIKLYIELDKDILNDSSLYKFSDIIIIDYIESNFGINEKLYKSHYKIILYNSRCLVDHDVNNSELEYRFTKNLDYMLKYDIDIDTEFFKYFTSNCMKILVNSAYDKYNFEKLKETINDIESFKILFNKLLTNKKFKLGTYAIEKLLELGIKEINDFIEGYNFYISPETKYKASYYNDTRISISDFTVFGYAHKYEFYEPINYLSSYSEYDSYNDYILNKESITDEGSEKIKNIMIDEINENDICNETRYVHEYSGILALPELRGLGN